MASRRRRDDTGAHHRRLLVQGWTCVDESAPRYTKSVDGLDLEIWRPALRGLGFCWRVKRAGVVLEDGDGQSRNSAALNVKRAIENIKRKEARAA